MSGSLLTWDATGSGKASGEEKEMPRICLFIYCVRAWPCEGKWQWTTGSPRGHLPIRTVSQGKSWSWAQGGRLPNSLVVLKLRQGSLGLSWQPKGSMTQKWDIVTAWHRTRAQRHNNVQNVLSTGVTAGRTKAGPGKATLWTQLTDNERLFRGTKERLVLRCQEER